MAFPAAMASAPAAVKVDLAAPAPNWASPSTSSSAPGSAVPTPTLPAGVIRIRSNGDAAPLLVQKVRRPAMELALLTASMPPPMAEAVSSCVPSADWKLM